MPIRRRGLGFDWLKLGPRPQKFKHVKAVCARASKIDLGSPSCGMRIILFMFRSAALNKAFAAGSCKVAMSQFARYRTPVHPLRSDGLLVIDTALALRPASSLSSRRLADARSRQDVHTFR